MPAQKLSYGLFVRLPPRMIQRLEQACDLRSQRTGKPCSKAQAIREAAQLWLRSERRKRVKDNGRQC